MTGNKKLHFQALIRTGYVKKGGTAYVKRNFNHPIYRSGLYEPDLYSHDFCPVCEIPSEKAMDQKAQEHLPCLLYTSDAADEGLGVDLGGRRIIKKIFFSSRRRHTRLASVSWARRCV